MNRQKCTQLVDLHNISTFIVHVHVVSRITGICLSGGEISADSGSAKLKSADNFTVCQIKFKIKISSFQKE